MSKKTSLTPSIIENLVFKIIRANPGWSPDEVFQTLMNILKLREKENE